MDILSVTGTFSAAHHLREYRGRCERVHGHNWKVDVHVSGTGPRNNGMVIDFGIIRKKFHSVLKTIDHTDLNSTPFFRTHNPTAENIAQYIFESLNASLRRHTVHVVAVTVWESDDARATYTQDPPRHVPGLY